MRRGEKGERDDVGESGKDVRVGRVCVCERERE